MRREAREISRLLRALSRGTIDINQLASEFGLTPEEARSRLQRLREHGFDIGVEDGRVSVETAPEYGYGIAFGLEAAFDVEYHETINSTNARARDLAAEGDRDVVVAANEQTSGRGRRDRAWASPPGGVWLSLLLDTDLPPRRAHLLTLAAGVAVARSLREVGVAAVLKWPNDVLHEPDETKLAGVLTEAALTDDRVEWVVVGIGINANTSRTALPEGASSVCARAGRVDRRRLAQRVIEEFSALRENPDAIPGAWRELAATLGRDVTVTTGTDSFTGRALDVDASGALVLDTGAEAITLTAGECEHLRPFREE